MNATARRTTVVLIRRIEGFAIRFRHELVGEYDDIAMEMSMLHNRGRER